jgi:hypothetical protein
VSDCVVLVGLYCTVDALSLSPLNVRVLSDS